MWIERGAVAQRVTDLADQYRDQLRAVAVGLDAEIDEVAQSMYTEWAEAAA